MFNKIKFKCINWIRLVSAGLIFFYSLLTVVDTSPTISMLWNLKAIEHGSLPILLALIILILPTYKFNKIVLFSRLLALIGLLLLLNPAWQARSLLNTIGQENQSNTESFSWKEYLLPSEALCSTQSFDVTAENGEKLESIVCLPKQPLIKKPCILIIHGGGFTTGAAIHALELAKSIASEGYVSLSIDYRLAPETQFPGQLNDINVLWNALKHSDYATHFDTNAFFLVGESAGASIALNYGQFADNEQLKGIVNLYGITDFELKSAISAENKLELMAMIDAYRGNNHITDISPGNTSAPVKVPVLTIHGEKDAIITYKQALEFHHDRERAHLPSEIIILPWAIHLFNHPANGPSGQVTKQVLKQFIEKNS